MTTVTARIGKDQARTALVGLRLAIGAGAWLAPKAAGRVFGINADRNPVAPYLGRLFGVRDLWLAAEVLMAEDASARDELVRRHVYIDAADTVAAVLAGASGGLSLPAAAMCGLTSGLATVLGWRGGQD